MNFRNIKTNSSGSSTIFVIVIAAAVMVGSVLIFNTIILNDKQTIANIQKVKASYEAEGFIKGQINLTKQFIAQTDNITTERLTDFITPHIPSLTPPGFEVRSWEVSIESASAIRDLPSGPFIGMQSEVRTAKFKVTLASTITGAETSAELDGLVAGITFTQFGVFSFYGWVASSIVNRTILSGRAFANGTIMVGSSVGLLDQAHLGTQFVSVPYLTTASTILSADPIGANVLRAFIASDNSGTNFLELKYNIDSGCMNCDNTGLNWKEYALARWNGRVQDFYHGVPRINIKTAVRPRVQGGNIPERLLIDPVMAAENDSVKQAKFAYKADIRIINGVWYLKNPDNEREWPGIPIWSDHPGSFRTTNEEEMEGTLDVGQTDIANYMIANFPFHGWPTNTTPKKFSYYEYDADVKKIKNDTTGVISYGNLTIASGVNIPASYVGNNISSTKSSFCYDSGASDYGQCTSCATTEFDLIPISANVTCASGTDTDISHRIVNATRSGFRFGLWQNHSALPAANRVGRSKIYPMNFDIARFQDALGCTHDPSNPLSGQDHRGELGCYFKPWGLMGRPFNGIVYITNTWAGSLNGLKNLASVVAPPFAHTDTDSRFFGSSSDANQTPVHSAGQSQALPFQLCSTSFAGENLDAHGAFKVPNCNQYANLNQLDQIRMRTTALRIFNGGNISNSVLPKGLSIVSNLHVYMQGDMNTSSNVSSATATPWVPMLVAGDDIIYFSNNWNDQNARWDVGTGTLVRTASNTTYNVALMKYWPHLLLNENWGGRTLRINGPQILPHYSIYPTIVENYSTGLATWNPPAVEAYRYDPHFQYVLNQPPGVPFISVFATSGWKTK